MAKCTFANGVWLLNVKWRERRKKLTGCGNIDKAKERCEIYQREAAVPTDSEIIVFNYLTTVSIIILPENKTRSLFVISCKIVTNLQFSHKK